MKLISLDGIKTFLAKLNSLVVHKAGTETVTGAKTFTAETNVTYPTDSQYIIPLKVQCPSMTEGHGIYINLGKEGSQYNRFSFGFQYKGNHNSQNAFTFSAFAQGTAYSFDAAGNANFPTSLTVPKINGLASKATADASGNNIVNTYATKSAIPIKTSQLTNDSGYLTAHQDLSAYALKTDVPTIPTKVSAFVNDAGYLTVHQDLSAYAKKTDIPTVPVKGIKVNGSTSNLTADTSGVVTIPAVPTNISAFTNDAGYLTTHQDLSAYALKTDIPTIPTKVSAFTNDAGYLTTHQDLSAYALKTDIPTVPTKVSAFTNDAGYLTSHQDLSAYAKAADVVHKTDTETITGAKTFSAGITSTTINANSVATGSADANYFQCRKFRGEGDANTYYHAIDFGYSGHNQVDFHEYGGTWNFYMNQDGLSTSGTLVGSIQPDGWHGNVIGNASSATKATQDGSGNVITDTYATKASVPTKVSQLTNDSGYLTSHQDISGKADKSTTLAGYGITDAYTSAEVDSKIKAAIGAIADYDSTAF